MTRYVGAAAVAGDAASWSASSSAAPLHTQMRKVIQAVQKAGQKKDGTWRVEFGALNAQAGSQFEVRAQCRSPLSWLDGKTEHKG